MFDDWQVKRLRRHTGKRQTNQIAGPITITTATIQILATMTSMSGDSNAVIVFVAAIVAAFTP